MNENDVQHHHHHQKTLKTTEKKGCGEQEAKGDGTTNMFVLLCGNENEVVCVC